VPDYEFLFALELSEDERRLDGMLTDVAAAVLAHVGYHGEGLTEVKAALRGALAGSVAGRRPRFELAFRAHAGQLQIVVSCGGRPEWRTTLAVPQSP
jgi:hypothetical protein